MTIVVNINLDRYSPDEIIHLCEDGILTVEEVVRSGRMTSEFGDDLKIYIARRKRELKQQQEDTI